MPPPPARTHPNPPLLHLLASHRAPQPLPLTPAHGHLPPRKRPASRLRQRRRRRVPPPPRRPPTLTGAPRCGRSVAMASWRRRSGSSSPPGAARRGRLRRAVPALRVAPRGRRRDAGVRARRRRAPELRAPPRERYAQHARQVRGDMARVEGVRQNA